MSDEYLWDRSGDVDPEIARLEQILRPLGHAGRPLDQGATQVARRTPAWRRTLIPLALAASIVVAVGTLWLGPGPSSTGWMVESTEGDVAISGEALTGPGRVAPGDWIETAVGGRARLRSDGVGTITLGPRTRFRATRIENGQHWFVMETGSLDADISAAPGVFAVTTPLARAIDLGCRYTLKVDDGGEGMLHVTLGWVGLERGGRESLVPAGAMCAMQAATGPGTPYFEGATAAFVEALSTVDRGTSPDLERALDVVLEESRPLDAITLWHLLSRLERAPAGRVFDRLAQLVAPPTTVTREQALGADPATLAAWWEAIGLGDLTELRAGMLRVR